MKWTLDWLKDYLNTNANSCEIADTLTRIGLEVDSVVEMVTPIAAKIVSCEDIPGTHLHKLLVDDGSEKLRDVVCGAPNARADLCSALALPGCKIGDMEIKSGKIRGFLSDGMMCSEKELGLGDDHSGIIELDEKSEIIGKPISKSKTTTIFEASITPNRPDYLSVSGIARDLSAAGIGTYKNQTDNDLSVVDKIKRNVVVENKTACPVYEFCEIHGIKMAPSNSIISGRLVAIGINPKNAPIDITNYICFDLGQPMHCFDADEIKGDIIVRNAKSGEKFTDLFNQTHELIPDDLVIADESGILALAGIIGGMRGMTTDKTENIILEAAYFEPVGIRKTRTRLGLNTDSSYRFERGIYPYGSKSAIKRASDTIMKECGGKNVCHKIHETEIVPKQIKYKADLFKKKTGIDLSEKIQTEILERLNFYVGKNKSGGIDYVQENLARPDIQIPENIVSEIIRIYGYDKIKVKNKDIKTDANSYNPNELKHKLSALGLCECISYGFADSDVEQLLSGKENVLIANPILETMNTARNSLLPNLLGAVAENARRGFYNLGFYEYGTVFDGKNPGNQHDQIVIVRSGLACDKPWAKHGREVDIYDIRKDLMTLFNDAKAECGTAPKWAHPYRYGRLMSGGKVVAEFGELHPLVAKKLKIKTNVMVGIVDNIEDIKEIHDDYDVVKPNGAVVSESEFLPITRDFAFIVNKSVKAEDIANIAITADSQIIDSNIFDVFDMGDTNQSVAFEILIQPEKNLNSEEILEIQDKVISRVESKFNAKIRSK